MKMRALIIATSLLLFLVGCNKEKEMVIWNTANPKYDLGIVLEDIENEQVNSVRNVYDLRPGCIGKIIHDTAVSQFVKPIKLNLYMVSKDGEVMDEIMERNYRGTIPYTKVFGKEIDLNPYLLGVSCDYMRFSLPPYSYNDLIFCTINIIGKNKIDNKNYYLPITLIINNNTKECTVVGRGHYIDGMNMAIYDGKYFGILDFYMDSYEYIVKYYDKKGNYVGWSPSVNLVYTKSGERFIYKTPLRNINTGWHFTYGNDKYGRPISMKNSKEKYEIKYTSKGYHITGYDDKGRKKYDFEPNDINEFIDLRTWNRDFKNRGKLIKYSYDYKGVLDSKKYYNASQSYYLREEQKSDGSFVCRGIYRNSDEFMDDLLIDISITSDYWTRAYSIYRIDPKTGIKSEIASLPREEIKQYLLKYLYNLE